MLLWLGSNSKQKFEKLRMEKEEETDTWKVRQQGTYHSLYHYSVTRPAARCTELDLLEMTERWTSVISKMVKHTEHVFITYFCPKCSFPVHHWSQWSNKIIRADQDKIQLIKNIAIPWWGAQGVWDTRCQSTGRRSDRRQAVQEYGQFLLTSFQ